LAQLSRLRLCDGGATLAAALPALAACTALVDLRLDRNWLQEADA